MSYENFILYMQEWKLQIHVKYNTRLRTLDSFYAIDNPQRNSVDALSQVLEHHLKGKFWHTGKPAPEGG